MFKVSKNHTRTMCQINILKVSNKGSRMTSRTSIFHFIQLLILLNLDKQLFVGPEKWYYQSINLFSVVVRNMLLYGLYVFTIIHPT